MWSIAKRKRIAVRRYEWEVAFTSHGLTYGYALTRRRAEKKLARAQHELLLGDQQETR